MSDQERDEAGEPSKEILKEHVKIEFRGSNEYRAAHTENWLNILPGLVHSIMIVGIKLQHVSFSAEALSCFEVLMPSVL